MIGIAGLVSQGLEASTLELQLGDLVDELFGVSLLSDEGSLGVGKGLDGSTELKNLECGVLRDIARTRDGDESGGLVERVFWASLGNHLKAGRQ